MTAILVLDVESTGKDRAADQIIELCLQLGLGTDAEGHVWRIKPTVAIHAEAQAVHGISAADLEASPPFAEVAPRIVALLAAADVIVGYNVAFDLDMLQSELARAGLPPLDLAAMQVVDVLRLWQHVEPRTLVAAHEKFCGAPLTDAHQASADVAATARVLSSMIERFGLTDRAWPELAAMADPFPGRDKWIGPSHHIQWTDDGNAAFAFGKHKGTRLDHADPGFLRWVVGKDFPPHVRDICAAALQLPGVHLKPWIAERYPRRIPTTEAA